MKLIYHGFVFVLHGLKYCNKIILSLIYCMAFLFLFLKIIILPFFDSGSRDTDGRCGGLLKSVKLSFSAVLNMNVNDCKTDLTT